MAHIRRSYDGQEDERRAAGPAEPPGTARTVALILGLWVEGAS